MAPLGENAPKMKVLHDEVKAKVLVDTDEPRWEYLFPMPSFLSAHVEKIVRSPQDMTTMHSLFNIVLLQVGLAMVLFFVYPSHWLGLAFTLMSLLCFLKRFILLLHYAAHTSPFKSEYRWLNTSLSYLISPFFGIPPGQ